MGRRIELNVLGRLEIRTDGEPIELRAKKARALLAYLAVENGRPITLRHSQPCLKCRLLGISGSRYRAAEGPFIAKKRHSSPTESGAQGSYVSPLSSSLVSSPAVKYLLPSFL